MPAIWPSDIGLYYTTGMVEDHAGLNNERISEEAFLDQCEIAWREREAMMLHELESFDDGLFYCLFDTPDRVQHLFWRFREPDHPANRGEAPEPRLRPGHRRLLPPLRRDRRQGARVQRRPDAVHRAVRSRFQQLPARRSPEHMAVTTTVFWRCEDGVQPGEEAGDLLRQVDWERTRAYALGLSGIYLNLEGPRGAGDRPPRRGRRRSRPPWPEA